MAHATTGAFFVLTTVFWWPNPWGNMGTYGKIWVTECYRLFSHQNLYQNLHRNRGFRIAVFDDHSVSSSSLAKLFILSSKRTAYIWDAKNEHMQNSKPLFLKCNVHSHSFFLFRNGWLHQPPPLFPTPGVWLVLSQGTRSDVYRHLRFDTWPIVDVASMSVGMWRQF